MKTKNHFLFITLSDAYLCYDQNTTVSYFRMYIEATAKVLVLCIFLRKNMSVKTYGVIVLTKNIDECTKGVSTMKFILVYFEYSTLPYYIVIHVYTGLHRIVILVH